MGVCVMGVLFGMNFLFFEIDFRATYGTTKYCSYYLRSQPCQNTLCQYLHEPGEEAESYIREEAKNAVKLN